MKAEVLCPLCGKPLKVSLEKNKRISQKDRKAKLKQHIELSNKHKDLRIPPSGSSEKLRQILENLDLL